MFTTRLLVIVKAISASRSAVSTSTLAQRRNVRSVKSPHHEDHMAMSGHARLQHVLAVKESEITEKNAIISTLRAQKQQNQQNQTTNAQTTNAQTTNAQTTNAQTTNAQTTNAQTTNAQNNTTIWTGGMTDTDGFGAGWRGKGWDGKVERKEGRMRELMRGMTARERERYDHL